ncbi:MAG: hypothetical protein KME10_12480 [Plectolyngbya sp. WJT66-NPBG17]|jgi:hypothetical protein|nr:hypothetical protein [Plectolyngbya sp. WJT66-NPBG17]
MASIEVIIRDDDGNIISQKPAQEINLKNATLDKIEAEVETWRKQALPEIEAELLQQAQTEFTAKEKTS